MINRYKLQAKRPHEDVFTEWCSTDNYEAVVRNIKVIESYGWEWQLKTEEDEIIKQLKSVAKAIESLKIEQPSMSREKQIEEMARDICRVKQSCNDVCHPINSCRALKYAERFYNAGYRKQSEGEWIKDEESKFEHRYHCSVCNFYLIGTPTKHCEECRAKMKGGAE